MEFSAEQRQIMRDYYEQGFRYFGRDQMNGWVFAYKSKPFKSKNTGFEMWCSPLTFLEAKSRGDYEALVQHEDDQFKFIDWDDPEPFELKPMYWRNEDLK